MIRSMLPRRAPAALLLLASGGICGGGCSTTVQYAPTDTPALQIGYRGVNDAGRRFPDYSSVDASILDAAGSR